MERIRMFFHLGFRMSMEAATTNHNIVVPYFRTEYDRYDWAAGFTAGVKQMNRPKDWLL